MRVAQDNTEREEEEEDLDERPCSPFSEYGRWFKHHVNVTLLADGLLGLYESSGSGSYDCRASMSTSPPRSTLTVMDDGATMTAQDKSGKDRQHNTFRFMTGRNHTSLDHRSNSGNRRNHHHWHTGT